MQYKGIEFSAIIATPGCGKSYLADRYDFIVDADEERLKNNYLIPKDITREELEKTKGDSTFLKTNRHFSDVEKKLDELYSQGKIIIGAPHPEMFDYFEKRSIKFCFVYPNKDMKMELNKRFHDRGNSEKFIKENFDMFEQFYQQNIKDKRAVVHYQFGHGEYLKDILEKFGVSFDKN